jgi:hypothetical protein
MFRFFLKKNNFKRFQSKKKFLEKYENKFKVNSKVEEIKKENYDDLFQKEMKKKNKWYFYSLICFISLFLFKKHQKELFLSSLIFFSEKEKEELNQKLEECFIQELKKKNFEEFSFLSYNEYEWPFLSHGLNTFILLFKKEKKYLKETSTILNHLMHYGNNDKLISQHLSLNSLLLELKQEYDEETKIQLGEFIYQYFEKEIQEEEVVHTIIELSTHQDITIRKIVSNYFKFFKKNEEMKSFLKKLNEKEIPDKYIANNISEASNKGSFFSKKISNFFSHPLVFKSLIFVVGGISYSMLRFNHKFSGKFFQFHLPSFRYSKDIALKNLTLLIPLFLLDEGWNTLDRYLFSNFKIEEDKVPFLVFIHYSSILLMVAFQLRTNPFLFYPLLTIPFVTYDRVLFPVSTMGIGFQWKRYNKLYL